VGAAAAGPDPMGDGDVGEGCGSGRRGAEGWITVTGEESSRWQPSTAASPAESASVYITAPGVGQR
jgi:hypothetical protein